MSEPIEIRGKVSRLSFFLGLLLVGIGFFSIAMMMAFQVYDPYGIVFACCGFIFGPLVILEAFADSKIRILFTTDDIVIKDKSFLWEQLLEATEEEDCRYASFLWKSILVRRVKKLSLWFKGEPHPSILSNTFLKAKDYDTLLEKARQHVTVVYHKKESR